MSIVNQTHSKSWHKSIYRLILCTLVLVPPPPLSQRNEVVANNRYYYEYVQRIFSERLADVVSKQRHQRVLFTSQWLAPVETAQSERCILLPVLRQPVYRASQAHTNTKVSRYSKSISYSFCISLLPGCVACVVDVVNKTSHLFLAFVFG